MRRLLKIVLFIGIGAQTMSGWAEWECVSGNCYNGYGIQKQPFDGPRYTGSFLNGEYHGKGVMTFADGGSYEGDFVGGRFNGKGVLTFESGARHEGDYKDGKWHGQGVMTFADGARYEGGFVENRRSGKGTMRFPEGEGFEAIWENDKPVRGITALE